MALLLLRLDRLYIPATTSGVEWQKRDRAGPHPNPRPVTQEREKKGKGLTLTPMPHRGAPTFALMVGWPAPRCPPPRRGQHAVRATWAVCSGRGPHGATGPLRSLDAAPSR